MADRLVVCFDGTWNKPDNEASDAESRVETNVRRLFEAVLAKAPDGTAQWPWYDKGVGTRWYDRIRGGVFGFGLDENIKQGYEFLVNSYEPGDEIFVFGFSRGAYTARSLVGLIRNAGLVNDPSDIEAAYTLYRNRDRSADTAKAEKFRAAHSLPQIPNIKFLGVWDTVGALGIPISAFQFFNKLEYGFHDTELSGIVENAYHAVAIDEHRVDYQATLWSPIAKQGQSVEQRWFPGAHADVGGGYASRKVSDTALAWMMESAAASGLGLDPAKVPKLGNANYKEPLNDSYKAFMAGLYAKTHPRYLRPIDVTGGSTQILDQQSIDRRAALTGYTFKNEVTR